MLSVGFNEGLLTPLWFLPCLMIAVILYSLIYFCVSKLTKKNGAMIGITFILSIIGYNTTLPRNISLAFILMFWFCVGNYCKIYDMFGFVQKYMEAFRGVILNILIFAGAIGIVLFSMTVREHWSDIEYYIPLGYLAILSGIVIVMQLSWGAMKIGKILPEIFAIIGQHTVVILALHITIFRIIDALQVILYKLSSTSIGLGNMYHNGAWIVLYPILGVTIPLMLSIGVQRIIEKYK